MKLIVPLLGLTLAGFGFISPGSSQKSNSITVVISGGARGHLSPCGCTKPMSGGFKRLATIVRDLKAKGKVIWVDAGDIIDVPGRQAQLKAETYGELMGALGVDVVAYTTQDQKQGSGLLAAASALSGKSWLSFEDHPLTPTKKIDTVAGFTISTISEQAMILDGERDSDILLIDGPEKLVSQLTKNHQILVVSSDGTPSINGRTMSPGSHLRGVIIATFQDGKFVTARTELLNPTIKEDPKANKIYQNYLARVTQERLIDSVAKVNDDDFAGSKNCKSCHGKTYQQYSTTKHAHAYQTLEKEGHGADPDCVGCHVVGLNSTKGFFYQKTQALAQVGCESCHGPGRAHARNPMSVRLPKVTDQNCITCHTPSNSPGFVFKTYWEKIKHQEKR